MSQLSDTNSGKERSGSPAPASALLQDLLRERKAESRRTSHARNVMTDQPHARMSGSIFDDREVQSSPMMLTGGRAERRGERRASGHTGRVISTPKEMGVREMEEVSASIVRE
jgi:D-serine deaminase-like pyridoxal phosphate-dependent protein